MILAKPLTFMNLSGQAVQSLAHFHKVEAADLLVVADDVNLPLGRLRARRIGRRAQRFKSVADTRDRPVPPRLRVGVGGENRGGSAGTCSAGSVPTRDRRFSTR